MKNSKLIYPVFAAIIFIFAFTGKSHSQITAVQCKDYASLYNTIISGKTASIDKTTYLKDFKMIEVSRITITPITEPQTGYDVNFKITDLYKADDAVMDENSVIGFMMTGCKEFANHYKDFINTSCSLTADTPDDAVRAAKSGIDSDIDMKYAITGDLVTLYQKTCLKDTQKPMPVKKPAVYLYPESDIKVNVQIAVNGKLTFTEPLYKDGWEVNATSNGLIDDKYDYLFYEADLNKVDLPSEGWIVSYNELENWFNENLPSMGLNKKETEQFKEYWLKNLKKSNYYEIRLLGSDFLSANMKLVVTPEPQSILRLNFHFKPVSEKTQLTAPTISKFTRTGFTVVEWGGINGGDLKITP
ncbi:MAG: hypothetical protein PHN88_00290 [Ignavibacteria bacterium]|nr:hypothetical protein [Ignavibacteria bacterium]